MLPLIIVWYCHSNSQHKRKKISEIIPKVTFIFNVMSVDYPEPLIQEQQAASTRPDHVYQGVTIISDPTQWLPTPQNLKQKFSLSAFEWVHLPDFSEVKRMSVILVNLIFSLSTVKYWVLSNRAIIVMLHVWQRNRYELKSSGYIFEYFPVGLIAHKWKARVCVLLLGVNTSVCACGLLLFSLSHSQQWRSRNLFIA